MKKTQLLLATSKSRDTHPLPVGRHIPELEGARSATESPTNNRIRRTGKRKTHYEWLEGTTAAENQDAVRLSCRAGPERWQHAQGIEQLRNQRRDMVQ